MSKPCYPKVFTFMSHLLNPNGLILSQVVGFFGGSFTEVGVCFPSNRRSFRDYANMFSFMCGSRGKCLVISLSYHTNISFIISSLFYNTMYPSWLATFYSCTPFMVLVWSYHWQSKYPLALVPLWEWAYNNPWHTSWYYYNYYFGELNTCSKGGLPPFPLPHPMTNGYFYYQRRFLYFDEHYHC
jgi:hypothetical protein